MVTNKSENCILKILLSEDRSFSTEEILERVISYPDLCRSCKSGNSIISAALKLVDKGIIKKYIDKGGFKWKMIKY